MRDKVQKYLCLEDSCKGQQPLEWIHFLTHQRVVHLRQWTVHFKTFTSIIEFQVWCKFVQEAIMKLAVVKAVGDTICCLCRASTKASCPAKIFSKKTIMGNKVYIFVIYMGEHYGHDHSSDRSERLFLLDYSALAISPMDHWLLHFKHAGVFIQTQSTPVLREMARKLASRSRSLIVIGFMNTKQVSVLKKFHFTLYLEDQGNWIVMYSIVKHRNNESEAPIALPIAYLYSNYMNEKTVSEFFCEMKNLCGPLRCNPIITNNVELVEDPWNDAFPDETMFFMLSWQSSIAMFSCLLPNPLNCYEVCELGEILKKSICAEFPHFENIMNHFLISARQSKKLSLVTIVNLFRQKHQKSIEKLVDEWIQDLRNHEWVESFHERMFLIDHYFLNKSIMKDSNLPKVLMHLTIFSNHVHNTSPPLQDLVDFMFTMVSLD